MGTENRHILQQEDMSEYVMQKHLATWKATNEYIIPNIYLFRWESDFLIKMKSGYWYECEVKISFSDFKNDFKAKGEKHGILRDGVYYSKASMSFRSREEAEAFIGKLNGEIDEHWCYDHKFWYATRYEPHAAPRPNYFLYAVPWYMEEKVTPLIPEYAGLIVLKQNHGWKTVKKPPLIHGEKYTDDRLGLCQKFYWRWKKNEDMARDRLEEKNYTIKTLRSRIEVIEAEFKAVTGYDFKESL